MMNFKVLAAALLAATVAQAQDVELRIPRYWTFVGFQPARAVCKAGIDEQLAAEGTDNVTIICPPNDGGAVWIQNGFDVTHFRGRRVRISGELKTAGVVEDANVTPPGASFGTRIDRGNSGANVVPLAFGEFPEAGLTGSTDWTPVEVVADIPVAATTMTITFGMRGRGQAWLKNVAFEEVGLDVPVNVLPQEIGPKNLELK
jgi:hypothetical protein